MSKSAVSVYILIALLVGTNAMWLYGVNRQNSALKTPIEVRCTRTEESTQIYDSIVLPLTDAIAAAAKPGASKESIVRAASFAGFGTNPICMNEPSVVGVRGVGLRFNDSGQLTGATVAHCPP